jgi:hypothetical protein
MKAEGGVQACATAYRELPRKKKPAASSSATKKVGNSKEKDLANWRSLGKRKRFDANKFERGHLILFAAKDKDGRPGIRRIVHARSTTGRKIIGLALKGKVNIK